MNHRPSIVLDEVEYFSGRGDKVKSKTDVPYLGIIQRQSDGFTVLSLGGEKKAHNIEVGQVYSVTINSAKHMLSTKASPYMLRAAELRQLIEGNISTEEQEYLDYFNSKIREPYNQGLITTESQTSIPKSAYILIIFLLIIIYFVS